jgi:outer membrane protein assembly factor BamB
LTAWERGGCGGPLFAVIPTVTVGPALAMLAMLFPALFGGLLILAKRWASLLTAVSLISTLYFVQLFLSEESKRTWWGSDHTLWLVSLPVLGLCVLSAWRRHLARGAEGAEAPPRTEHVVLWLLTTACAVAVGLTLYLNREKGVPENDLGWKLTKIFSVGIWAGTLYALWLAIRSRHSVRRLAVSTEGVVLVGMMLTAGLLAAPPRVSVQQNDNASTGVGGIKTQYRGGEKEPFFQHEGKGMIASTPLVTEDRVFVSVITGVIQPRSLVYCLDRAGKILWTFDGGEDPLKQMFSSFTLDDGKLYFGEGFHENSGCRLFCINASTGKKLWDFETNSHTESTPCVADGRVLFGAGDDGVYGLDATTGKKLWQYPDPEDKRNGLHVDASPCVQGNRLYCGSGFSRTYQKMEVFCLDTATGKRVWRVPELDLPVWGSPAVAGEHVYVGLGNGKLTVSDVNPRGGVLCLDAATGTRVWQADEFKDAVHTRPTVDAEHVYVGSRDGHCYALDRATGKTVWKQALGSPVVGNPVVAPWSWGGATMAVYALGSTGKLACLAPDTGAELWSLDLSAYQPSFLTSPSVMVDRTKEGDRRQVFVSGALWQNAVAVIFRLEDEMIPAK